MSFFKICRKWTLLSFNVIFLLIGGTLIILGTLYKVNLTEIDKALPPSYYYFESMPITTIVLGIVISLTCIFGTWGLFRKNSFLLTTHCVILLTIFIIQVIISIMTFVQMSNKDNLAADVNKTMEEVFSRKTSQDTNLVDFLQQEFKCCGTYGPNFYKEKSINIPNSCYKDEKSSNTPYEEGCQIQFYNTLLSIIRITGITMLVASAAQVIGATLSMSMANSIRNFNRRYGRYMK